MNPETQDALEQISKGAKPSELESETLDFKQDASKPSDTMDTLARAAICFANSRGGTIVLGVIDKIAGPSAIVGTGLDPLEVKQRIYEKSRPPLLVDVAEHWHDPVMLLVVAVAPGVEIHASPNGEVRHRVGRSCLPMTAQEQVIRSNERRGVDWSAQPSQELATAIAADALEVARRLLRLVDDDRAPLARLDNADLLRSLGVIDDKNQLLHAGEALFCDRADDRPWVLYQYRPSPAGEATAVERLAGPLVTVLDRLTELVWARRHTTPLTLPDGSQIELADFPREAVREAVANAILHRELLIDRPVQVEHSPSALVVESPGRLVSGITENNILTHPSKPRNPCLFLAARKLRIAEETGSGIDRIYRELIRSGRDAPTISQTADTTRVAFTGGAPRTQVARFVAGLGPQERDDVDTLLIIFTLLDSRTIDEARLAPIIQKQPSEARAVLDRLASDQPGILETTLESRASRKPTYRLRAEPLRMLGNAAKYQRRRVEDTDVKVIAHVKDYGRINNRTIQDMFDMDVYRASTLLRDLQDRGVLVKTTTQQRGPGVEYGPGPEFPSRRRRPRD
ncbi:MAG: putative DNA binding domain-containing protein [Acidimicrobiia bacterium]|nr:putative DNA binding domain-containing protein [Acidimicrobiia bacterium]